MPKTYTVTLTLPNGKRKYFRGTTKREAEAKRESARRQLSLGMNLGDRTTVKQLSKMWIESKLDLKKRSKETIEGIVNRYILPEIGDYRVRDVRPLHIARVMGSVKNYSGSTRKKVYQFLVGIFDEAVDNGMIEKTPVLKKYRPNIRGGNEVQPLTEAQCKELVDAVKDTRAYPFVLLLLYTGLRRGEALGLMWSDIDFNKKLLRVDRSIVYPNSNKRGEIDNMMKTEKAHRVLPLSDEILEVLKNYKRNCKSIYVFPMADGSFMSESAFRRMWELVTRRVSFDLHPHQLRHTCITNWFSKGLDLEQCAEFAGHASADITLRIYTHYVTEDRFEASANQVRAMQFAYL